MLPDYFSPGSGWGWSIKKIEDKFYFHYNDTGLVGLAYKIELTEEDCRYAMENKPSLDEMDEYLVKRNQGRQPVRIRCT